MFTFCWSCFAIIFQAKTNFKNIQTSNKQIKGLINGYRLSRLL